MARATFGGTAADYVVTTGADGLLRLSSATLTMWTAATGGTQITDLLLGGSPVTSVPVGADGSVPTFQGPDGVTELWADAGHGRVRLTAPVTVVDSAVAALASNPASATGSALSASIGGSALPRWKASTAYTVGDSVLAPDGTVAKSRTTHTSGATFNPANWTSVADALSKRTSTRAAVKSSALTVQGTAGAAAYQNSTGITQSGSTLSATTPGTEGRVWAPLFNANKSCRLSATVLASKATAGSYSLVSIANVPLGTAPGAADMAIGVGYVQGVGIITRRSDGGFDKVLVADSAITDGQTYRVSFVFDNDLRAAGAPNNPFWYGMVHDADGNMTAFQLQFSGSGFANMGMLVARTTVANGLTDVRMAQDLGGEVAFPTALTSVKYTALSTSEQASVRIPARPNGRLVVVLHGRGGNDSTMFQSAQYEPTWKLLLDAGYTLFMPKMGGDTWWSPAARAMIVDGVNTLCSRLRLDRSAVFLWGDSMGGGTALALVGNNDLGIGNVAAAYVAEPALNLDQVLTQNSSFTEIATIYPAKADRDAASPNNLPTANYAGVPILFLASTSDSVVVKTQNTDLMRTKIGSVTNAPLLATSGAHTDPTHYNAAACLGWFTYAAG